jgi:hypothetical protein
MKPSRVVLFLGALGAASLLPGCTQSIGAPCATDADCTRLEVSASEKALGVTPFCKHQSVDLTHTAGFTYPGGYCTKRCGLPGLGCGADALCELQAGLLGEYDNICVASCFNDGECRDGYACLGLFSSVGACLPLLGDGGIPALVDAGPGMSGPAGAACTSDDACRPPGAGYCRPELLPDGGPSGHVGGECSAECGAKSAAGSQGSWCGEGGACTGIPVASTDGLGPTVRWECFLGCGAGRDAGCREGYVCTTDLQTGVCVPSCHNAGAGCPAGSVCDPSGRCL